MAQARQNTTVRRHHAQPPVPLAAADVRSTREQVEQLTRKLAAAQAEIRRYQTRLFACERQMVALRRENAELEAACEEARQQALLAAANAEAVQTPAAPAAETQPCPEQEAQQPQTAPQADVQPEEAALPEPAEPAQLEPAEAAPQEAAAQLPPTQAEPVQEEPLRWSPKTKLDHLSVELMNWFDKMMGA